MFYVAYFKDGENPSDRPITFAYNGGPGSATMWLHMGCFGPHRVVTTDHAHTAPPLTSSSTTTTACWMPAISCSSMPRARGSRA